MLLVPTDLAVKSSTNNLPSESANSLFQTELDSSVSEILHNTKLDADLKHKLYSEALVKYINFTNKQQPEIKRNISARAIAALPKTKTVYGTKLLDFVNNAQGITTNDRGELILAGQTIANSNVDALVDYISRDTKLKSLTGFIEFKKWLLDKNVDPSAIGNRNVRREIEGQKRDVNAPIEQNQSTSRIPRPLQRTIKKPLKDYTMRIPKLSAHNIAKKRVSSDRSRLPSNASDILVQPKNVRRRSDKVTIRNQNKSKAVAPSSRKRLSSSEKHKKLQQVKPPWRSMYG